jgi:hypothetical protein
VEGPRVFNWGFAATVSLDRLLPCNRGRADSYCTVSVAVAVCATVPAVAVTVTVYVPAGVGVLIVTIAVSDFVTSACETADTDTGFVLGTVPGAVYIPVVSIVPTVEFPPVTPLTCQVTC